jgi:hypothetical protein
MPLGLNINNPQEENPEAEQTPQLGGGSIAYGGNSIGGAGGSADASATQSGSLDFSTILFYGALALVIIFILKKIGS